MLETKYAVKQYSLGDLGKGRSRGGKSCAKKRRLEMLDRLARLGQGLSAAQRNDFSWFKDAWDARMLQGDGGIWPVTFMGWVQRLLGENDDGVANTFPFFFHGERRRCFDGDARVFVMAVWQVTWVPPRVFVTQKNIKLD